MLDWISNQDHLLWWLGISSVIIFVGSLILVPILIVRLPADYFTRDHKHGEDKKKRSVGRIVGLVLKNVLGVLLMLAGVAMLALPGQGILTLLLGLMLTNFPGKQALMLRLLRQPRVLRTINKMRRKKDRPPLKVDKETEEKEGKASKSKETEKQAKTDKQPVLQDRTMSNVRTGVTSS